MGSEGRRETLIIVNPAAHNVPSRKRLDEAERWLRSQGWQVEWRRTEGPRQATELAAAAAARGLPLLFVCGGDGTLNEAANGLADSETALAPIRAGTVNIWAKEMGFPRKPVQAVKAAVEGDRHRIDLGRAGERYFLLMAGYGLDGALAPRGPPGVERRPGGGAYALPARPGGGAQGRPAPPCPGVARGQPPPGGRTRLRRAGRRAPRVALRCRRPRRRR